MRNWGPLRAALRLPGSSHCCLDAPCHLIVACGTKGTQPARTFLEGAVYILPLAFFGLLFFHLVLNPTFQGTFLCLSLTIPLTRQAPFLNSHGAAGTLGIPLAS